MRQRSRNWIGCEVLTRLITELVGRGSARVSISRSRRDWLRVWRWPSAVGWGEGEGDTVWLLMLMSCDRVLN